MTLSYSKSARGARTNRSASALNKFRVLATALLFTGFNASAQAGLIQNLHEAQLDAIFSQASFGSKTIDIRFNPSRTLYNSAWLVEETDSFSYTTGTNYQNTLGAVTAASGLSNSLTVPMFYIDDYTTQGQPNSTVGLGWIGDNGFSVKTSVQTDLTLKPAGKLPCPPEWGCGPGQYVIDPAVTQADIEANYWRSASVVAHELSHNLGLPHSSYDASNLMYPVIGTVANYTLTTDQVARILSSRFVQTDANGQRFISITPFAVVASVPVPAAWLMFSSGLGLLAWRVRGRTGVAA